MFFNVFLLGVMFARVMSSCRGFQEVICPDLKVFTNSSIEEDKSKKTVDMLVQLLVGDHSFEESCPKPNFITLGLPAIARSF